MDSRIADSFTNLVVQNLSAMLISCLSRQNYSTKALHKWGAFFVQGKSINQIHLGGQFPQRYASNFRFAAHLCSNLFAAHRNPISKVPKPQKGFPLLSGPQTASSPLAITLIGVSASERTLQSH